MSELPISAPTVNAETLPFWQAAARGVLSLPRCNDCEHVIFYPRDLCPVCHSRNTSWVELSGRGSVYSYTAWCKTCRAHCGKSPRP